jgi:EpsI family protein
MNFRRDEALLFLAVLLFFSSSIIVLSMRWFLADSYYSQGPLVLAAFLWLLYRNYKSSKNRAQPSRITGTVIIVFAMFLDLSGRYLAIETFQYFAVYFLIAGLVLFYHGRSFALKNFMLFVYLLLAIPLPGFILDPLTFDMKMFSAHVSELILSVIYPSIERYGSMLYINNYYIEITPACSGMENLFGMVSLLWFFALIQKRRFIAWIDYLISIPAAIISNILRIIIVSVLTVNGYGKFALEDFHEGIGILIFLVILFLVSLFNELSFGLPASMKSKDGCNPQTEKEKRDLLPYIVVMIILTVFSLVYQVKAFYQEEKEFPDKLNLIAAETDRWSSVDEPLPESYYRMLNTDDILMRQYIRKGSTGEDGKVYLYFFHSVGDRGPFLHRPELCLKGEGYNLLEQNDVMINGTPARRMLFSRNGRGLLVYYWYRFNDRTVGNYIDLQKILITQFAKDYDCMMFRLSRVVQLNNVEKGESVLLDFARNEMPLILKKL